MKESGKSVGIISERREIVRPSDVSALQAEVWSLKKALSEAKSVYISTQETLTEAVREKYELIEELTKANITNAHLRAQLENEGELNALERKDLLNEIFALRNCIGERNKNIDTKDKIIQGLQEQVLEANQIIIRMSRIYLTKVKRE